MATIQRWDPFRELLGIQDVNWASVAPLGAAHAGIRMDVAGRRA